MVADSQPGHIDQIKQTNAGAVYRLIDQLGPVSRIDLSRFAQLAPASITKIVREMLEAHLVQETEIQEPGSRGRPAVGLVVETEAWHYLSLRISRGEIFLALRDAHGGAPENFAFYFVPTDVGKADWVHNIDFPDFPP